MIGKIKIPRRSSFVEATLEDDGKWRCESDMMEMALNTEYAVRGRYASPSMGAFGAAALHDAAAHFGGVAEYLAKQATREPGTIY